MEWLWCAAAALAAGATIAILDRDVEWGGRKVGRPVYGVFVLGGLLGAYAFVLREGYLPLPGWLIVAFAIAYLPFLSSRFIDLETTDQCAVREIENLLLDRDIRDLRNASGTWVLREGRRRMRVHWDGRQEGDGVLLELDVHPSLFPVTVSRPHVVLVRDRRDLERMRGDIRRRREQRAES
ncbi:MAG: hypothetical protein U0167_18810 [bacterium]